MWGKPVEVQVLSHAQGKTSSAKAGGVLLCVEDLKSFCGILTLGKIPKRYTETVVSNRLSRIKQNIISFR